MDKSAVGRLNSLSTIGLCNSIIELIQERVELILETFELTNGTKP